jgi:Fe2+ or Zn2+ uptake regulation protein
LEGIKTMTHRHFCVEDHEVILYGSCETCLSKKEPVKAA